MVSTPWVTVGHSSGLLAFSEVVKGTAAVLYTDECLCASLRPRKEVFSSDLAALEHYLQSLYR
nr:hypothetical protein BN993_03925 [Virgibacillus halodenitrificans]